MRVVVTGAAGFIGSHLVAALLRRGRLSGAQAARRPIRELVLVDQAKPSDISAANGIAVRTETGNLSDPEFRGRVFAEPFDSVFHLAATLTTEAERDMARGLEVNVLGFLQLLDACRAQPRPPRLVFASSIATFGGPLPAIVDDSTAQTPQTSYGAHKVIAERLIDDHSRHGVIDGRALRLPIVLIRPGAAVASVSDQVAAIVREPLLGRDLACPLQPDTRLPVVSVQCVANSLIVQHDLPASAFGHTRAFNLPALSVTVAEMIAALQRVDAGRRLGRISWAPDPALQQIVDNWPKQFESARARELGIGPDASFHAIIEAFLASQS